MTRDWLTSADPEKDPAEIDTTVAHPARMYDYIVGGTTNFAADREATAHAFAAFPGGVDGARASARANRAFLGRAVRYLTAEAGIRQFLDIGTGIPMAGHVHEIAQQIAPECRIVYTDNDAIVLAHAHALLKSTPEGATAYFDADLRDPRKITREAATTLDFAEPIAIMLTGVLHVVPDDEDPYGIVASLMNSVVSGSYLAISHFSSDRHQAAMDELTSRASDRHMKGTVAARSHAGISRFFEGLELLEPGLVQIETWRKDEGTSSEEVPTSFYSGVGRKP